MVPAERLARSSTQAYLVYSEAVRHFFLSWVKWWTVTAMLRLLLGANQR